MNLAIRLADARDADAVRRLMGQITGREMSLADTLVRLDWVARSPVDWLYVAEVDGQVRGLLGFRLRENIERPGRYGEISALVVDAGARRQGIGRALMVAAEQLAREHGCIGTWLVSGLARAEEAHRFYAALGYQVTGYRFVKPLEE